MLEVLCVQSILCADNKTHPLIKNGVRNILSLWPMRYKPKNMVVSNLPVRLCLNKLAVLATGETKNQLLTALGVTIDKNLTKYYPELRDAFRYARDSSLIMLNRLFVKESGDTDPGFFNDTETFGVEVGRMRFDLPTGAANAINQWVSSATFMRIRDVITENDIDPSTSMVLINALHIKPTWNTPFDIRLSLMKPFTLLNGKDKVMVRMMTALETRFLYAENNEHDFQILKIMLRCHWCRVTYVLPRNVSGLPKLLKVIFENPELIPNTMKNLRQELLNVRLPVMKIKTLMNWNPYLQGIGVRDIFDHYHSGLDAISKPNRTKNHHMSKFLSKVFIDVDEFGIHRKAPDQPLDLGKFDMNVPLKQFIADHPFYFRLDFQDFDIEHHELFSGVYYGPED